MVNLQLVNKSVLIVKYFRLTAHHPFLGDNDGHPVGLSLFENDIAVFKFDNAEDMQCRKKKVWPACLPSKVGLEK